MPRVSVIIPTYNRAQIVGEAIENVLAQTYQDSRIIVAANIPTDTVPKNARTMRKSDVRCRPCQDQGWLWTIDADPTLPDQRVRS